MVSKNVYHICTHIYMDGERKREEGDFSLLLHSKCEAVLSPDGQGQVSHTKFSYSSKKLCNSAKHVLWGRRLRIISYPELTFTGSGV